MGILVWVLFGWVFFVVVVAVVVLFCFGFFGGFFVVFLFVWLWVFLVGFVLMFLETELFIRINRLCCLRTHCTDVMSNFLPSASLKLSDDFLSFTNWKQWERMFFQKVICKSRTDSTLNQWKHQVYDLVTYGIVSNKTILTLSLKTIVPYFSICLCYWINSRRINPSPLV